MPPSRGIRCFPRSRTLWYRKYTMFRRNRPHRSVSNIQSALCRTLFHLSTRGSGAYFPRDTEYHITVLVSQDMGNGKNIFSAYAFHVYLTGVIPQAKYSKFTYGPNRPRGWREQSVIAEALQLVLPSCAPEPSQSATLREPSPERIEGGQPPESTTPPHTQSELNAVCCSSSLIMVPADFYTG